MFQYTNIKNYLLKMKSGKQHIKREKETQIHTQKHTYTPHRGRERGMCMCVELIYINILLFIYINSTHTKKHIHAHEYI